MHARVVEQFSGRNLIMSYDYKSWSSWNRAFARSCPYPAADLALPVDDDKQVGNSVNLDDALSLPYLLNL